MLKIQTLNINIGERKNSVQNWEAALVYQVLPPPQEGREHQRPLR